MRQVAANDPGNEHAIPYMWGTTGLGYNPAMVKKMLGTDTIDSWAAVFDPTIASKLAKCGITMLDSPEDVFEAAEIYLGNDPGNEDAAEMAATESLVTKIRPYVRSFDSNQHLNALGQRRRLRLAQLERLDATGTGPRGIGDAASRSEYTSSPRKARRSGLTRSQFRLTHHTRRTRMHSSISSWNPR